MTVKYTCVTYFQHFEVPDGSGVNHDVATGAIRSDASAADVLSALSAVLNPNNVNPALPFTDNVAVDQHGNSYTITFQGAYPHMAIASVDTSALAGSVQVATRLDGIDYYNV